MQSRLLVFGGFDPLSHGRAASRARSYLLRVGRDRSARLGVVTSEPADPGLVSGWAERARLSGLRLEVISLDASDAASRLRSFPRLHFPAGHTGHLLHRLRPLAGNLRREWEHGLVVSGSSGGGLCWFSWFWSASMFGEPEWTPGLDFVPLAAAAHHDEPGYRRPEGSPPSEGMEQAILALDNDALLDWTPGCSRAIAIRPGAAVSLLDASGRTVRTLPGRDLSPLYAWLIRVQRALRGRSRT